MRKIAQHRLFTAVQLVGGPALQMTYRSDELLRPGVLDLNQPGTDPVQLPQLLARHRLQYGSVHPM